jgi:hypothetical protein
MGIKSSGYLQLTCSKLGINVTIKFSFEHVLDFIEKFKWL